MSLSLDTIHREDCIRALSEVAEGSVDLVFADPPFNIGYDYDVYDDRKDAEQLPRLVPAVDDRRASRAQADGTFWLAIGDEYAAELKVLATREHRLSLPQLGDLVLHVRRELQTEVQPLARAPVPLRERPEELHVQCAIAIAVPSARHWSTPTPGPTLMAELPDDTWILRPQDCTDGFRPD